LTVKSNYSSIYGDNAINLPLIYEAFQIDQAVRSIVVSKNGLNYSYNDLCYKNSDDVCSYNDVLQYWNRNLTTYLAAVGGSSSNPTAGSQQTLIQTVNYPIFPDNRTVSTLTIFGGLTLANTTDNSGESVTYLSGAGVVVISYSLESSVPSSVSELWYNAFISLFEDSFSKSLSYADVAYVANNSADKEIGRSINDNIILVIIAVIIFIVVAVLGLSDLHPVGTRTLLGVMGVVSAIFALVVGYGLSMIFGISFTMLDEVLPFILLGVAVDCMFILTKSYDVEAAENPSHTLKQRMTKVLSSAGLSVQVTLMASTVAFALGTISELPSIRWFSVFATMSTFSIMISSTAFFMCVFVMTEWRIAANRYEIFCCFIRGGNRRRRRSMTTTTTTIEEGAVGGGVKNEEEKKEERYALPPLAATLDEISSTGSIVKQAFGCGLIPNPHTASLTAHREMGQDNTSSSPSNTNVMVSAVIPPSPVEMVSFYSSPLPSASAHTFVPVKGADKCTCVSSPTSPRHRNYVKFFFERVYAPAVTHPIGKAVVIVIFLAYFAISIVGSTRLTEGQPLKDIAPDDSYLQKYITVMTDTFNKQVGSPTRLYFRHVDPSLPEIQEKMLKAMGMVLESPYINSTISTFVDNWLISFLNWAPQHYSALSSSLSLSSTSLNLTGNCTNPYAAAGLVTGALGSFATVANVSGCVPQTDFNTLLSAFLSVNPGLKSNVLYDGASVWASSVGAVHSAPGDNGKYGRLSLASIRNIQRDVNDHLFASENENLRLQRHTNSSWASVFGKEKSNEFKVFMINNKDYLFDEGDAILGRMTMEYVLLALAGVGLIMLIMLGSISACALMIVAVGLVDLFLFGELWMVGLRFNQVSVICLVMATGLAVDYSVYVTQKFMVATGTRDERVRLALVETGSAVFLGGISALLGSIPLAAASSAILRTFFALIFGTIVFSLLIGLVLMPVVLSLIGPDTIQIMYLADPDEGKIGEKGKGQRKGEGVV